MLYVFDIITYALITVQKLQINASGQLWPSRGIRRARRELNIVYASNVSKVAVVQVSTGQFLKKGDRELISIKKHLQYRKPRHRSINRPKRWPSPSRDEITVQTMCHKSP